MEDYKEKYEMALEGIQEILSSGQDSIKMPQLQLRLQGIFPELRGDEDEKIRKALVRFHKSTIDIDGIKGADILAWLEKQGESYTKNDVDDAYLKGISDAKNELEKQGTPAKLSEEEQNSFAKGVLSRCALSFIDYLDAHSYEGKMCVSNGECEDIDYAFHNAMWDRLHRYYCKYIEKQGEHQQLYIRFGNIPANEKSKIYRGEKEIGSENGVSVYPAFKLTNGDIVLGLNLPITKTTLHTQQHLLEYDNRPCYLVTGDYIGNGADGEPLIRNVEIVEEIKDFRVKEGEARYKIKDSDSISVNGEPFDYEHATITQKDFAPEEGEQKPILDFKASNFYVSKVDGKIHDITYNSTDKVEPIFSIGDVLCDKSCTTLNKKYQPIIEILDIRNGMYICNNCSFPISQQDEYELVTRKNEQQYAWSDEDEKRIDCICDFVWKNRKGDTDEIYQQEQDVKWLKLLKDRAIWKPSREQMEIFKELIDDNTERFFYPTLKSLYNDLKKLKEE